MIVSVKMGLLQYTDKPIDVKYSLSRQTDDKYGWIDITKNDAFHNLVMTKGRSIETKLIFDNLPNGQYELILQALSDQQNGEVWGNRKQLLFTVTSNGVVDRWLDTYIPDFAPSVSLDKNTENIAPYIRQDTKEYMKGAPIIPGDMLVTEEKVPNTGNMTISGNWKFHKDGSTTKNIRNAKVVVKYRDQFYIWREFGSTYTDVAGNWSITGLTPNANYWEVIIYTQSSYANVKNPASSNNTWSTNMFYLSMIDGSHLILTVPNNTQVNSAFQVYDDVVTIRSLLYTYKNPGNANNIIFDAVNEKSIDGKGNRFSAGTVYLYRNAPTRSTVMHELAHNYMYNLYGNSIPPAPDCSPHYFNTATSDGCAWVEGWASFLPIIFSDGVYKYSSGGQQNLESYTGFATGNNGENVEGRVVGSLWDLYDSNIDGYDTRSYSFQSIYKAMWDEKINTIGEYWSKWKGLGYDINAKDSFKQNGIIFI